MGQDVEEGRLVGGRYRLGGVLGRGGMGTVWRGEDELLGRPVAVKELRFPSSVDEEEKQRLITRTRREAKAIARIRSGSAVTVFDVVDEDDRPWIVMELVEGCSLAERIRNEGPLTPRRAAQVGLAVLDVLRAAHREGILHRDVKPSNVLLEEGTDRVVLTDFGIAKVEGDPSITSTGMLVGAPSYISPERARGKPPGPPADLWSLGGLLYAAVEGKPPYDKGSALSTLTAVMTEPLPAPRKAGELTEVILGLLRKDPDERLDADGAQDLLDAVASGAAAVPEAPDATRTVAMPPAPAAEEEKAANTGKDGGSATEKAETSGADAPTGGTASDGGEAAGPAGRRRAVSRRAFAIVAAVVAALLVVGAVVLLDEDDPKGKDRTGADRLPGGGTSGPKGGDDAESTPETGASDGADDEKQEGRNDDEARGDDEDALPEGYTVVEDSDFHFSAAMPEGFERYDIAGKNSGGKYADADGGYPRLQVDFTGAPGKDALGAWKAQESSVRSASNGYRRISMKDIEWRDYPTVADWHFERTEDGTRVRVLNRGFKVDDGRGYAILVTCRVDAWDDTSCKTLRETVFRTFRPK